MAEYFRWFVSSQRRSDGINLSKAITFGIPQGRGKKGNRVPRNKSRRVGETITTIPPPLSQHPQSTFSGLQLPQSSGIQHCAIYWAPTTTDFCTPTTSVSCTPTCIHKFSDSKISSRSGTQSSRFSSHSLSVSSSQSHTSFIVGWPRYQKVLLK